MTTLTDATRCVQRGMHGRRCSLARHHRGPHVYRWEGTLPPHGRPPTVETPKPPTPAAPLPARCERCGARVWLVRRAGAIGWWNADGTRHDPCEREPVT